MISIMSLFSLSFSKGILLKKCILLVLVIWASITGNPQTAYNYTSHKNDATALAHYFFQKFGFCCNFRLKLSYHFVSTEKGKYCSDGLGVICEGLWAKLDAKL